VLDPFRRGPQRQACAQANADTWLPANNTAPPSLYQSLQQKVAGKDIISVIAAAAGQM
jgi:hypothetical protein